MLKTLTFEKREIDFYAQHVTYDELTVGDDYYMISYADGDCKIPVMESLIYLGKNIVGLDSAETLYFQDAESYRAGVRVTDSPERGTYELHGLKPDQLDMIYDFERALEELMRCSMQRKKIFR
ncbi:hypothetical protein KK141_21675 [Dyella sp. LX-66]|uniref:hypothetical protein n=1 Tax=unclassified Dyella TaxID=2634549 RepID=UPI001BE04563|nr:MULTISPECIES: hypothetical protein [unclassified Dyella]MBT2119744.1 hypothetical protein [Dyella sp. LX-1]MBT2142171.1 hypothetical protein [Dyella sp. LX-66]